MEPFEIMVSESQERMLCVVEPARRRRGDRADRHVGGPRHRRSATVTDSGRMRIFDGGELVGDMPVAALVDDCPLYDLAPAKPTEPLYPRAARDARRRAPRRASRCSSCSPRPNIASRRPLFEQYDSIVQSRTVRRPEEADAAVLALPGGGGARGEHRRQRPPRRGRPLLGHGRASCSSARRTSPASAPSRSARPTT